MHQGYRNWSLGVTVDVMQVSQGLRPNIGCEQSGCEDNNYGGGMSLKLKIGLLVGILLIAAFAFAENGGLLPAASVAAGQPATAAALPDKPAAQPMPKRAEKPLGVTFGLDERYRGDVFNNADATGALNDESRFARFRTRVFVGADLSKDVDAYLRMGNESWKRWYQTLPGSTKSTSLPLLAGEIWVDAAYLNIKKMPGVPKLSLKVGRFDMITNEGFMFFAGDEGVGPRSAFFTGLRADYKVGKQDFALMAFYTPRNDFFPVINGSNQSFNAPALITTSLPRVRETLQEQDIDSFSLYYTNRNYKNTDIDLYETVFHEYDMSCSPSTVTGACTWFANAGANYSAKNYFLYQPDRKFSLFGGRIVQRFPKQHFVIKSEVQGEIGTQNSPIPTAVGGVAPVTGTVNIRAWGEYGYATEYFQVKTKPYLRAVYVFLSGSKPGDLKTDGHYDNSYNRWAWHPSLGDPDGYLTPLFSDLYVYAQNKQEYQNAPAYMSNLKILGVEAGFTPIKKTYVIAAFQNVGAMNAYAPNPIWGGVALQNTALPFYQTPTTACLAAHVGDQAQCSVVGGTHRYNMIKADIKYTYSPKFNFNISGEKLYYGDFYNTTHRSNGYYVRTEINYTWSTFKPFHKM